MDEPFPDTDLLPQRNWGCVFLAIAPFGLYVVIFRGLAIHAVATVVLMIFGLSTSADAGALFFSPVAFIYSYVVGSAVAILVGWPIAATLEWLRWRSWWAYLAAPAAAVAVYALLQWKPGREGPIPLTPYLIALAYACAYSALYRQKMSSSGT